MRPRVGLGPFRYLRRGGTLGRPAQLCPIPERAGQCPAPTRRTNRFCIRRRGGCPHPPVSLPLGEGGWPKARRMRGQVSASSFVEAAHCTAWERPDEGIGPYEKNAAVPRVRRLPEPHLSPPQQRRCQRGECQALGHHQISGSERRGGGVRLNHPRLCVDGKARLTCKTARRVVAPYTGWKPAPSSVTASPCHLPPRGKALERWRRNPSPNLI